MTKFILPSLLVPAATAKPMPAKNTITLDTDKVILKKGLQLPSMTFDLDLIMKVSHVCTNIHTTPPKIF